MATELDNERGEISTRRLRDISESARNRLVYRSALLMTALGIDVIKEPLKLVDPVFSNELTQAFQKTANATWDEVEEVLNDFVEFVINHPNIGEQISEFESLINRTLQQHKGVRVRRKTSTRRPTMSGIESLQLLEPHPVADLIGSEHPQVIAATLAQFEPAFAARVIEYFPIENQTDITLRMAQMDMVSRTALDDMDDIFTSILVHSQEAGRESWGGIKDTAKVLSRMSAEGGQKLLRRVGDMRYELAEKLEDEMFTFEDLATLDGRSFQTLLRAIKPDVLVKALKGTSEQLRAAVYRNMSTRAAAVLKDELDMLGPVRISDVEAVRKEILKEARELAKNGQLVLAVGDSLAK